MRGAVATPLGPPQFSASGKLGIVATIRFRMVYVRQLKTGARCRGERVAMFNQILRIEENLGADACMLRVRRSSGVERRNRR